MELIGECDGNYLVFLKTIKEINEDEYTLEIYYYDHNFSTCRDAVLLLKEKTKKKIKQVSLQCLPNTFGIGNKNILIAIVYEEKFNGSEFSTILYLLNNECTNFLKNDKLPYSSININASYKIQEELILLNKQSTQIHAHILNPNVHTENSTTIGYDTPFLLSPDEKESKFQPIVFRTSVLVLILESGITVFDLSVTLNIASGSKGITILSSEFVNKDFYWSQWNPKMEFLTFVHSRKTKLGSIDYNIRPCSEQSTSKQLLSIMQFHKDFPRETVLNIPLEEDEHISYENMNYIVDSPNIFGKGKFNNMRILSHSSGSLYIFQLLMTKSYNEKDVLAPMHMYKLNAVHHNKTIKISNENGHDDVIFDVNITLNGQFVAVLGYPYFVHILDVGVAHKPSHHLFIDLYKLFQSNPSRSLIRMIDILSISTFMKPTCPTLRIIHNDLKKTDLEINGSMITPLILSTQLNDLGSVLGYIHFLIVHLEDINAAKKILYEICRSSTDRPFITEIFQEFVMANCFLLTGKQLMPNMKIFLNFLPYTSLISENLACSRENSIRKINSSKTIYYVETIRNLAEVSTVLLAPRQRVIPHNVTDQWTQLWNISELLRKSTRFCHKTVVQKLVLSLQCYQPEALSRATTPMSPSSPMICNTMNDIAALFGRRASELQLPFYEQESCTENKQEYIYSVNLRELSTHLLKERRDWPLHGQTVAGKYMNALVECSRLLCHIVCVALHLEPKNNKARGFSLIDSLNGELRLKLFILFEHIVIALGGLASPLPHGFTPFFAYLGYRVLNYKQFLWNVRTGVFDLQIDIIKRIMSDFDDSNKDNVTKKLQLISLLPKSRANRVLNSWSHKSSILLKARQHASDLLNGSSSSSFGRKSNFSMQNFKKRVKGDLEHCSPLETFFNLLTAKANPGDIDLCLLTEATMLSMHAKNDENDAML